MLELQNLKKKYQSSLVIDVPLLIVEAGIYWVKGVNGSGKTTFLKMVAGLLPFEGNIQLAGISIKKNAVAYRRLISWAEAEPLFPSFMSGQALVELYMKIKKVSHQQVQQLIDRFEMASYINQSIGTYSAGMTKKLSLLLAFIGNPSLLILDEPLITLDAKAVQVVSDLILESNKQYGCSFLMSSHQDMQEEIAVVGKVITISATTIILE